MAELNNPDLTKVTGGLGKDRFFNYYTVQWGDTFQIVMKALNATMEEIFFYNPQTIGMKLYAGDELKAPKKF